MRHETKIFAKVDWISVTLYIILVLFGLANIYAANYNPENPVLFDTSQEYFKQMIWIGLSCVLILFIFLTDSSFFPAFAYVFYGFAIFMLLAVLLFGKEVNGAKAWFEIGSIKIQPVELAKLSTALALARLMSRFGFHITKGYNLYKVLGLWVLPILMVLLQNDTGSALVFFVFFIVFYREGFPGNILLLGIVGGLMALFTIVFSPYLSLIVLLGGASLVLYIQGERREALISFILFGLGTILGLLIWGFNTKGSSPIILLIVLLAGFSAYMLYLWIAKRIKSHGFWVVAVWSIVAFTFSADYFFDQVLSDYQRRRINVVLGVIKDPLGAGYNVNQSQIAIGSGGVLGKGYLQGTQTKLNFVPEQSTDFIFCTVGEEWGFVGTTVLVLLFVALLIRLIILAERQHSAFSRIFGYSVMSIFFFHLLINIGMTIGLVPVIGIPLPFFSYGGSSLWGFTVLLFIFLKLDTNRNELIR